MIRAVIFDFDGTLADTMEAIHEAVNLTMDQFGFPRHSIESVRSFINNGARELVRRALPAELQQNEAKVDRILRAYNKIYGNVYLHTRVAYDGIVELVAKLRERGLKIGVLSNKQNHLTGPLTEQVLGVGMCDVAQGVIESKPAKPDRFLSDRVAAELGVSLDECIMIGDSDVDIQTAQNAGMKHIGVCWGYRSEAFLRESGAKLVASSVQELEAMIFDFLEQKG